MKFSSLTTAFMLCCQIAGAQAVYPWNPDENNDNQIGSADLIPFLTVFGTEFQPQPVLLDSTACAAMIADLQSQIDELQQAQGHYVVKLAMGGGVVQNILEAWGPNGNNLLLDAGWSFDYSASSLTINHPAGMLGTDFIVHVNVFDPTGGFPETILTKAISGSNSNANSITQYDSKDRIELNAIGAQMGVSSVTTFVYLTWRFIDIPGF